MFPQKPNCTLCSEQPQTRFAKVWNGVIIWCYQAYYYEAIIARIVGMLIGEVTDSNLMRTKPSIISRANLDPVQTGQCHSRYVLFTIHNCQFSSEPRCLQTLLSVHDQLKDAQSLLRITLHYPHCNATGNAQGNPFKALFKLYLCAPLTKCTLAGLRCCLLDLRSRLLFKCIQFYPVSKSFN